MFFFLASASNGAYLPSQSAFVCPDSGVFGHVIALCLYLLKFSFPFLSFQVLLAVLPQANMQYFDVEVKTWRPLAATTPSIEATNCFSAVSGGNNLYVAGYHNIYRYDTEGNVWEKQPHSCGQINNFCIVDDFMYAISSDCNQFPQRYSFSKCQWQTFAKVKVPSNHRFYCSGATVLNSKLYVLYGGLLYTGSGALQNAELHCFDPVKNEWEVKAKTCERHYGSSLFVVNSTLYVAGGTDSNDTYGDPAPVEAYNEENNTWSVVEQKHIPPNNRILQWK